MAKHQPAEHEPVEKKPEHKRHKRKKKDALGEFDARATLSAAEKKQYDEDMRLYNEAREKVYQEAYPDVAPEDRVMNLKKGHLVFNEVTGKHERQGTYKNAQTGKFESREKYEQQIASGKKIEVIAPDQPDQPNYEEMGFMELVVEAADAQSLNDIATIKEIDEAIDQYITHDAMSDDSLSPEEAQQYYDTEFARFKASVDHLITLREKKASQKADVAGAAIASVVEEPETSTDTPEEAIEEEVEIAEEVPEQEKPEPKIELYYDDQKVEIQTMPKGFDGAMVRGANGEEEGVMVRYIDESVPELYMRSVYIAKSELEERTVQAEPTKEATQQEEVVVDIPRTEHQEGVASKPEAQEPEETEAEKQGRLQRMNTWFKNELVHYQHFGGSAYFAEKWERLKHGAPDRILNIGVAEDMDPDKKEARRKRNRTAVLIGAGALAAGAFIGSIYGAYKFGYSSGSGSAANSDPNALPTPTGQGAGAQSSENLNDIVSGNSNGGEVPSITAPDTSGGNTGVKNLELVTESGGGGGAVDVSTVPEAGSYPLEAFNIQPKQGGRELFENLHINQAEWPNFSHELATKFPNDFVIKGQYSNGDYEVEIRKPGWLSVGAQDYLRALALKLGSS